MKKLIIAILFTCACYYTQAQVNFVLNPDFENYSTCPSTLNQIKLAKHWSAISDTLGTPYCAPEYINTCDVSGLMGAPVNFYFYQRPHSKNGMAMQWMYSDTAYSFTDTLNRDYLLGRLYKPLSMGKRYCITFFTNLTEISQYGVNKIGAYLDDGTIIGVGKCGRTINSITPQVYTNIVLNDTQSWVKIEGDFIAQGTERYITIGNFFSIKDVASVVMPAPSSGANHFSNYLIDDVSVIEADLAADAGPDKWVPAGDSVWIGRNLDSTRGLDCKWYHHGSLIDSGAGIWVKATTVGQTDTYTVVQTICGLVKTDTVVVLTASVGINELLFQDNQSYSIFPNPSSGQITVRQAARDLRPIDVSIFNFRGEAIHKEIIGFANNELQMMLDVPPGLYWLQATDTDGSRYVTKFIVR